MRDEEKRFSVFHTNYATISEQGNKDFLSDIIMLGGGGAGPPRGPHDLQCDHSQLRVSKFRLKFCASGV